jgi:hypothetical protein
VSDESLQRLEAPAAPRPGIAPGRGTQPLLRSSQKLRATWGVRVLVAFGRDLAALTDPLWADRYSNLKPPGHRRPGQ